MSFGPFGEVTLMEIINENDTKVLVTGADIDGIARGKILNIVKFRNVVDEGFGFCNVIFAWDLHDQCYEPKTPTMLKDAGFSDIQARIDLNSGRRCPITNVVHFLVDFYDPAKGIPLPYCPRSLLKKILKTSAFKSVTGLEFEFFNFKETSDSLALKKGSSLVPLTTGMFGYSVARPAVYQAYFDDIYDLTREYRIPLECFHTETGN
jgi:glutamine synthetase